MGERLAKKDVRVGKRTTGQTSHRPPTQAPTPGTNVPGGPRDYQADLQDALQIDVRGAGEKGQGQGQGSGGGSSSTVPALHPCLRVVRGLWSVSEGSTRSTHYPCAVTVMA